MDALSDPRAFLSAQDKRAQQLAALGIQESDIGTDIIEGLPKVNIAISNLVSDNISFCQITLKGCLSSNKTTFTEAAIGVCSSAKAKGSKILLIFERCVF